MRVQLPQLQLRALSSDIETGGQAISPILVPLPVLAMSGTLPQNIVECEDRSHHKPGVGALLNHQPKH